MEFELGAVLRRTFGALGRNLVVFFVLALVLAGLPQLLVAWLVNQAVTTQLSAGAAPTPFPMGPSIFLVGVGGLVTIVTSYILQGALIQGAVADFSGKKAEFGECIATGLEHFLPLIAIAILMSIAIGLGMALLIVPGVILMVMWVVTVPARVAENTGIFASFKRSGELTKGHRWKIFFLLVIYMILAGAINLLGDFINPLGMGIGIIMMVVTLVVNTLTGMIGAVGVAALYFELRRVKEGIEASDLLAVFD